jgi:hypothetical protein
LHKIPEFPGGPELVTFIAEIAEGFEVRITAIRVVYPLSPVSPFEA